MHAVAGDDVARGDHLLAGCRADGDAGAGGVLFDGRGGRSAVDGAAERRQMVGEHALGLVLGQHEHEVVGRGQRVEAELQQRPVALADHEALDPEAPRGQRAHDAERFEHLQRVGVDHRRAGGVLPLGQAVDQQVIDAGPAEGERQREAGRAGADDQDIGGGGKHGNDSFVNVR